MQTLAKRGYPITRFILALVIDRRRQVLLVAFRRANAACFIPVTPQRRPRCRRRVPQVDFADPRWSVQVLLDASEFSA